MAAARLQVTDTQGRRIIPLATLHDWSPQRQRSSTDQHRRVARARGDLALEVTGAERGFVMLADAQGRLEFKVARAKARGTLSGGTFSTSQKVPEEVFRSGRSRVVADLMDGSQAGVHQGTIALGIRCVLCAPLRVARQIDGAGSAGAHSTIGVLYLDGHERATMLSRTTQNALETFATEAALAIESARLYSEAAEKIIRQVLAHHELKPWRRKMWGIPAIDAEYIACMEDVLNVLARPYDAREPVVTFDERSGRAARGEPPGALHAAGEGSPGRIISTCERARRTFTPSWSPRPGGT